MDVYFCGTRGSSPVCGSEFLRYGGSTSCVALAHHGESPSLVLDAGTGLANLDRVLGSAPFAGTILLGHLHWDHTHGLPFFAAGARRGHRVRVVLPEQGDDPQAVLARAFSPPHFPVLPADLGARWTFEGIEEGGHAFEGFSVLALEVPHGGGRTFGYRVSDGSGSLAYLSDHNPLLLGEGPRRLGALHPAALRLARDVDVLVHDAQYSTAELPALSYLGHSCAEYAIELAEAAGARHVVLFHHAPGRTDAEVDELAAAGKASGVPITAASDCLRLTVGSKSRAATGDAAGRGQPA